MPSAVLIPGDYGPEGHVASRGPDNLSPVTQPVPMHGPPNMQQMTGVPDNPRQSDEQGMGRSPGQRWPHMPRAIPFNFDSLTNMGWNGEAIPLVLPTRQGWSAPLFYEQYGQRYEWPLPISTQIPQSIPYSAVAEVPAG